MSCTFYSKPTQSINFYLDKCFDVDSDNTCIKTDSQLRIPSPCGNKDFSHRASQRAIDSFLSVIYSVPSTLSLCQLLKIRHHRHAHSLTGDSVSVFTLSVFPHLPLSLLSFLGVQPEMQTLVERRIYPFLLMVVMLLAILSFQIRQFKRLYEHIKNDKSVDLKKI